MSRRPLRFLDLCALAAALFLCLPGCGLVWWGAAAGGAYLAIDSSQEEEEPDPLPTNPEVFSISSTSGQETGGQTVTINGQRFQSGCTVLFGTSTASSVTFINAWMVQVVTPAVSTGALTTLLVDVTVINPDAQQAVLADAYTFRDDLAPATVTDLAVALVGPSGTTGKVDATVSFTAPGDNGGTGTAANYDLRWSSSLITAANFGSATPITWPVAPSSGGTLESQTLEVDEANLYFAMRATDDAGNVSVLSNVALFDAFPPARPVSFNVVPGTRKDRFLVSWVAPADDGSTSSTGPVTSYTVKYSRDPILTDADFTAATAANQRSAPWVPGTPGSTENFEIELPESIENTKYYFAALATDDADNDSDMSDCVAECSYKHGAMLADQRGISPGRRDVAVAYDPRDQLLLVFGGWDGNATLYGDVRALSLKGNGLGVWRTYSPSGGPGNLRGAAACWDPINRRMLVFGGHNGTNPTNGTFAFDFNASPNGSWTNVNPGGTLPAPRHGAIAVYDPFRKRMLIAGGRDGTMTYADVHPLPTNVPSPNWGTLVVSGASAWPGGQYHFGAFCPKQDGVILFGGFRGIGAATTSNSEIWVFSLNAAGGSWSQTSPGGATVAARGAAACTFDPFTERLWVTQGVNQSGASASSPHKNAYFCEPFANSPRWVKVPFLNDGGSENLPGVWGAGAIFDEINQRMVYFGGVTDSAGTSTNLWANAISMRSLEVEKGWIAPPTGTAPVFPDARQRHDAAYDWGSKRMIMFGGQVSGVANDETWSVPMKGNAVWTQYPGLITKPTPRWGHKMVTDSIGRRCLLFGGTDGTSHYAGVWEIFQGMSGFTWNSLTTTGTPPTGREGSAVVHDSQNNWLVVYGGNDGTNNLNDLYVLDLNSYAWDSLGTHTPPGRLYEAAAVYDPESQCMLVFGGHDSTQRTNDVWALDLKRLQLGMPSSVKWTRLVTHGATPSARQGARGWFDAKNHRAVFYGGETGSGQASGEMWALYVNGHLWPATSYGVWVQLSPNGTSIGARAYFSAAYDPIDEEGVIFGGADESADTQAMRNVIPPTPQAPVQYGQLSASGTAPLAREYPSAAMDILGNQMIVFGGRDGSTYFNDTHLLREVLRPGNETWVSISPSSPPVARAGHCGHQGLFAGNATLLVFGGYNPSESTPHLGDIQVLTNSGSWGWTKINPSGGDLAGRAFFASSYLATNLTVWGGETASGVTDELWTIDVAAGTPTWQLESPIGLTGTTPAARKNMHCIVYDRSAIIIYGGENDSGDEFDDVWMLLKVGATWVWVPLPTPSTTPGGRHGGIGFQRPGDVAHYVFGGTDGTTAFSDFWKYRNIGPSAAEWTQPDFVGGATPDSRVGASVVYDETNNRAIVFGGTTSGGTTNDLLRVNFFEPSQR